MYRRLQVLAGLMVMLSLAACGSGGNDQAVAITRAPTQTARVIGQPASTPILPTAVPNSIPLLPTAPATVPSPEQPAAQELKSEAGGFSVVTAAKLQEQVYPAATSGLTRPKIHSFSGTLGTSLYSVSYYTLPDLYAVEGVHTRATDPEGILGPAGFYLLIDALYGNPITLGADGYYRRELTYEHMGSRYKARLILAADLNNLNLDSNRVYAIFVSAPTDMFDEPRADDFINSFKVVK